VLHGGGHRPRCFPGGNDNPGPDATEHASRDRLGDQARWIHGVDRGAENVLKIGSKPLEGTAQ
jgi:hypothetical protein